MDVNSLRLDKTIPAHLHTVQCKRREARGWKRSEYPELSRRSMSQSHRPVRGVLEPRTLFCMALRWDSQRRRGFAGDRSGIFFRDTRGDMPRGARSVFIGPPSAVVRTGTFHLSCRSGLSRRRSEIGGPAPDALTRDAVRDPS